MSRPTKRPVQGSGLGDGPVYVAFVFSEDVSVFSPLTQRIECDDYIGWRPSRTTLTVTPNGKMVPVTLSLVPANALQPGWGNGNTPSCCTIVVATNNTAPDRLDLGSGSL